MPHQAADSITRWLAGNPTSNPVGCVLDAVVSTQAQPGLALDAKGLFYSATLSFLSAIDGLQGAQFSWAMVKLYYACFYAARSILASNGTCVFYCGTKPFSVRLVTGFQIRKEKGTTHKVVWNIFSREFPNNVLLNDIDGVPAYS